MAEFFRGFSCRIPAALLVMWLAGCVTVPLSEIRPPGAEQLSFTLAGRIAVRHNGERVTANLRWTHENGRDEILLITPLGQTVARVIREGQGVMLEASGKHYAAEDAEALTEQVLGWRMPLSGLAYWVIALPAPAGDFSVERDGDGRISRLLQQGWDIHYTRYAKSSADSLPTRMALTRAEAEIQLLIDEWHIH